MMPSTPPDTPDSTLTPRVVPEGWQGRLRLSGDYAHARLTPGVSYEYALTSMRWFADTKRGPEPVTGTAVAGPRGGLTIPFAPDAPGEWLLEITGGDGRVRQVSAEQKNLAAVQRDFTGGQIK